jgi:sulfite reductase (ferredoxin)
MDVTDEVPLKPGRPLEGAVGEALARWRATNVRPQPQPGYVVATVRLPLGDLTATQARRIAELARRFTGDTLRLTVEQNLVFRWVPEADLPELHRELTELGLGEAGASTVADITACPGTDTCKLGIASSRGLAAVLGERLAARGDANADLAQLRIKTSGCFNSCGQHHVADIGFLGVSRAVGGRRVPHFQLVVGGEWTNNGGSYGLAIGAFPSKRIPDLVERLTEVWLREREPGERLQAFIKRAGRAKLKEALDDLRHVPTYEEDRSYYADWGDPRDYTIGDMGVGECAGEVVTATEFGLATSEREVFEAQLVLEGGDVPRAADLAYRAMLSAAKALVTIDFADVKDDEQEIVSEFRTRFHDTQLFHDRFAGGKFAAFLFGSHEAPLVAPTREQAHQKIEEAQLFIEAAHACYGKVQQLRASEKAAAGKKPAQPSA